MATYITNWTVNGNAFEALVREKLIAPNAKL
jgi:hypothetical protein